MNNIKITKYSDLIVWQKGHQLVMMVYKLIEQFPAKETYCLCNQLTRAAVSITSNIAEGFGRQTFKEKTQFYYHSSGSLSEVENQLFIAKDLKYITEEQFEASFSLTEDVHKLLNAFIKSTKSRI